MLTPDQIDFITFLAGRIWLGLVLGGGAGLVAGASVSILRTHRLQSLLAGTFPVSLPAAVFGIAASLFFVPLQVALCRPGIKGGWEVPLWSTNAEILLVLTAGTIGALVALRQRQRIRWSEILVLSLLGAAFGCIAHLGKAFHGDYDLESNVRPIQHAVIGSVTGGIAVFLWCFVVRVWFWRGDVTPSDETSSPGGAKRE
ncbi:MAG: hypothetical protein EBS05_24050 [Proteobacteria bacterium]|nr:hypothetical protein [Pseudomonadota bacterium]